MSHLFGRVSAIAVLFAAAFHSAPSVAQTVNSSGGKLIHPLRLAVTGVSVGPGLFELLEVLGKEIVLRRIDKGMEIIPKLIS